MLRIITGSAKNRTLKTPEIEHFQAVQDVAKGALFSIIGEKVKNAHCLDLFSGSGNLGIEALSRGAATCDFVDSNKISFKIIKENLAKVGMAEASQVYLKESVKYVANTDKTYDLIFADPFYTDTAHVFLMQNLSEILNPNGLIAFFHGENFKIENAIGQTRLTIVDQRRFGKSFLSILG